MLPNKFDQYFRDKLLDHSTKVSPSAWKLIHAGLLRHKAFHLWKWYVAGPSVVVVALTGHLILAQINKPAKAHAGPAPHTLTQPVTTPAQQPATTPDQTATTQTQPATATDELVTTPAQPTTTPDEPATTPAPTATEARIAATTEATTNTTTPAAHPNTANTSTASTIHKPHTTNTHPSTRAHTRHEPTRRPETSVLASNTTQNQEAPQNQDATQSRPAFTHRAPNLAPRPTIVRPSVRLAITAKTPNPKSSKNLIVPATPYHSTSRWRFDGYASPEYFTFREFGFSYGAGARATFVFKKHYTITAGLQYLKVDVTAHSQHDSLDGLFPGYFNNIQMPVFFGYTVGNDRFSFTANAGAIFSVYADAHNRLKNQNWPNRNGPSAYIGFNFATRVNDRISLFAEPYIKCWYPQRFQDLPPHLYSTGISVGLRYDLK